MSNQKVVRVGSRKSELAIIQTKSVIARLQNAFPEQNFEIQTMTTMGDRVLNISLPKIGEKSLFTRDLEDALLCGGVDFVVHSLKDLPTALPEGMVIGAVLERDDERDALVLRKDYSNYKIETLPEGSVIGTSSLRRAAQLRKLYPHLIINDIRGNLNTRLAKLDAADSRFTGIILAKAGLERMNWSTRISQVLDPGTVLYAVGQGALAVECRKNDQKILGMIKTLSCLTTTCRVLVERSFLKTLGGGCSAPVAVFSRLYESNNTCESGLHIVGGVWSLDGTKEIKEEKKYSLQIIQTKQNIPALMQRKRKADFKEKTGDDILVDDFSKTFEQDTLLKKHIGLVSKCPYINTDKTDKMLNHAIGRGGGDADVLDNRCPLNFGVGQDFMGQCPFIKMNEALSSADTKSSEDSPSTSTNLAFEGESIDQTNNKSVHQPSPNCPFLKKNVEIFDYKKQNDEALTSALLSSTIKEHCGIYKHDFLTDDLFDKCNNFGIQLAEELIKHGALDIMHTAQAEIHKVI